MRQFFISLMGALAGIWLSVLIAMIGMLVIAGAGAAKLIGGSDASAVSIDKNSVLEIDLGCTVEERQNPVDAFGALLGNDRTEPITLDILVPALRKASYDKSISGIALRCGGISAGTAQIEQIVRSLNEFKNSGKWIYAYGDSYTQADYMIATVADSLFVNPQGMVDVHGLASTTIFFKDLLDKIGVNAQVVKVGTYKSAVEPYILNNMSEANKLQVSEFLNSIWHNVASTIGQGRSMTFESVNALADSSCYAQTLDFYIDHHMVDGGIYGHEFDELLADATDRDEASTVTLSQYATARNIKAGSDKGKKNIAVLYAVGSITTSADDGIASDRLVPAIFDLADNQDIDGLILRVNSGGGDAFASEQIWEALEQFKSRTGKPFYVSMSDMAASGGYYISCGADRIYAEPTTLTGSIGIFGIIPEAETLLSKHLGVNTVTVATNPEGGFPSLFKPMTTSQRKAMQRIVNNGYELFVRRCAEGRDMSVDSIKAIAEGRVWTGDMALENGLVDYLGGLDMAIADMKEAIDADECRISIYPDEEFNFMTELRRALSIAKMSIVKSQLGHAYPFYEATRQLGQISPIQCAAPIMIIE